ncbi:MAG: hypothetical protein RL596_1545 [Bacteroidota bacterium]|jgi:hypothetical protein
MATGATENNSFLNGMKWTFGAILALLITAALLRSLFSFFPPTIIWQPNTGATVANSPQAVPSTSVPQYVPIEIRPQPTVAATITNALPDSTSISVEKKAVAGSTAKTSTKKIKQVKQAQAIEQESAPIVKSTINKGRVATYKEGIQVEKTTALPTVSKNPYSSIRTFTRMELEEFMRQFPSRTTDIRFIRFNSPTNEMEGLKSQIIQMLQQQGYNNIDKAWRTIGEFSAPLEVHFGGAGYNAANFYIPIMQ